MENGKRKNVIFNVIIICAFSILAMWLFVSYNTKVGEYEMLKKSNEELNDLVIKEDNEIDSVNNVIEAQFNSIEKYKRSFDSLKVIKNEIQSSIKNDKIKSKDLSEASNTLKNYIKKEKNK